LRNSPTSATSTQFAGATGGSVGYSGTAADTLSGIVMTRIFNLGAGASFTKLRFSAAAVLALASKEFTARMTVWAGNLAAVGTDVTVLQTSAKMDFTETGSKQQTLWRGYTNTLSLNNTSYTTVCAAWSLTKIGDFLLEGRDYTSADIFTLTTALAGPGVKVLVIAVSLERTWATSAGTMATANATFTPGALLYLS
jgi:hypothetical protein